MILYFLRHASAGEHFANPKKDEKRALDKEGIEQCGYIGRALAALDCQVDAIVSSPLKRCTQTASLVATNWATRENYRSTRDYARRLDLPTSASSSRNMPARMPSWWSGTIRT